MSHTQRVIYQSITLNQSSNTTFFSEKNATEEGTFLRLTLVTGNIDCHLQNGAGEILSTTRLSSSTPTMEILPGNWHTLTPVSEAFALNIDFACEPSRYFTKKYQLGRVHSDFFYAIHQYTSQRPRQRLLDIGCGSGRNLLYAATLGHTVTGIDISASAITNINAIANAEAMSNVRAVEHDLHQSLPFATESFDIIVATVSLQFLAAKRIPSLISELMQRTSPSGLHILVFPIKASPYQLPSSFTYLDKEKALYRMYQDAGWGIVEYTESIGQLHRLDESGRPIQGKFGVLVAQKNN